MSIKACELDNLIRIDIFVINRAAFNDFVTGFFLQSSDKEDVFIDESLEPGEVVVAAVKDDNITRF